MRSDLSEGHASIRLYQIDSETLEDDVHAHSDDEILLVTQGRGAWRIGELTGEFGPGSIGYVRAGTLHSYRSIDSKGESPALEARLLYFPRSVLAPSFLDLKEAAQLKRFFGELQSGGFVQTRFFDRIRARLDTIRGARGTLRIARVYALFDLLSQIENWQVASLQELGKRESRNQARLKAVFDFIESKFSKPIDRSQVAAFSGMEASSFSRFFRRETGQTFADYLAVIRVRHAASQLRLRRGIPVRQIAQESGFRSLLAFERQFKRRLGATPAAYRRQQDSEPISP